MRSTSQMSKYSNVSTWHLRSYQENFQAIRAFPIREKPGCKMYHEPAACSTAVPASYDEQTMQPCYRPRCKYNISLHTCFEHFSCRQQYERHIPTESYDGTILDLLSQ